MYFRVGKLVPTYDFTNVSIPIPLKDKTAQIPAITSLLYTPIFVFPPMLGVMPGYYNSAYGLTLSFTPIKQWYFSYGAYDENLANGTQTGLTGPHFNGNYFTIGETGVTWLAGKNNLPGRLSIGAWNQKGLIFQPPLSEQGASGFYLFGTQRLWFKNPGIDNSGITGFYQYGNNNSSVLPMKQFIGAGLTAFGLIPSRSDDSSGIGASLAWLNQNSFSRQTELMYQAYYQTKLINNIFLEPALSYIPTPGASPNLPAAWATTLRAIVLL